MAELSAHVTRRSLHSVVVNPSPAKHTPYICFFTLILLDIVLYRYCIRSYCMKFTCTLRQ